MQQFLLNLPNFTPCNKQSTRHLDLWRLLWGLLLHIHCFGRRITYKLIDGIIGNLAKTTVLDGNNAISVYLKANPEFNEFLEVFDLMPGVELVKSWESSQQGVQKHKQITSHLVFHQKFLIVIDSNLFWVLVYTSEHLYFLSWQRGGLFGLEVGFNVQNEILLVWGQLVVPWRQLYW